MALPAPMHVEICGAIASRFLLAFFYDGHHRVVEPYCHGTGVDGQELLRAYQVGGTSSRGALGWKLFDASKIQALTVLHERFASRPDYNPSDSAIRPVHCRVG